MRCLCFIAFHLVFFITPYLLLGQWEKLPTSYFTATDQVQSFDNQLFCHAQEGVYRSKNEGASWELFIKALCCNNGYSHFLNINPAAKHYYFTNEETGEIQVSKDGGVSWQVFGQMPVTTSAIDRHRGLFFNGNNVYVFQQNYLAIKENGGSLNGWRPLLSLPNTIDTVGFIYKVIQKNTHLWAETNLGIYHSSNLGNTWTKPLGNTLRRLAAKGDTILVYSGNAPALRTNNNGMTWQTIQLPFSATITNILNTQNQFYAMISTDTLLSSSDSENWNFVNKNLYVNSIVELNHNLYLSVSNYGILQGNLLKSSDGGHTLYNSNKGLPASRTFPVTRFIDDYLHLSDGLGFSEDNGDTWSNRWDGYTLMPQEIFRAGNYYFGQYNINGSYSPPQVCPANGRFQWEQPVLASPFPRVTAVGDKVYGVANQTELFRAAPDGKSWTQTGTAPVSDFLLGWRGKLYATDGTKIVCSANEGQSWQTALDFGSPLSITTARFFVSGDTLLFSYPTTRKIYYVQNSGTTLDTLAVPYTSTASFFRLRVHGRTLVLYLGNEESVYISNNRGQSWLKIPFPSGVTVNSVIDALSANTHTLIVPGGGSFLWRLRFDGLRNLHGRVFYDINANGIQDTGEPGLPDRLVRASKSGFIAKTGENGLFGITLSNVADTLRLANIPPNFIPNPLNLFVSGADTAAVKIALQPGGNVRDAAVQLIVPTPFRAGFSNQITLLVTNQGTQSINPRIKLTLDPNISFESANVLPNIQNTDSVVWNLSGLSPFQSISITLLLKTAVVQPSTPVKLTFQANVPQEKTPADNVAIYNGVVVASYDPNDKAVSPSVLPADATAKKTLAYTIRFQNLGNAATDFVVIRDTLSDLLDPAQIRVLGSSHPMTWRLLQGKIIEFRFNPLFLPPAVLDERGSHGFVQFGIATKAGLAVGDAIKNKAFIYFDFNPAIITNTATTEVKVVPVTALSVLPEKLSISPNPAKDKVRLMNSATVSQTGQLMVFNPEGKLCFQMRTMGNEYDLTTHDFASGIYIVYWQVNNQLFFGKMEITD